MGEGGKTARERSRGWATRLLPLAVLVCAILLAFWFDLHSFLTLERLAEERDRLQDVVEKNYAATLLGYMGAYIVTIALSLPGGVFLTLLGGFLFGWLVGSIATVVAATIGATVIFLIAKTSLGEPLAERAGPWLTKLRAGFQEDALNYLLFLRLVPLFPFWLVNLAPALLGVPLATYVAGTFLGIIPGTFAFTFTGVGLDSLIEAQREAYENCLREAAGVAGKTCEFTLRPGALITKELLIAFVALGAVALLPVILRKLRKNAPAP